MRPQVTLAFDLIDDVPLGVEDKLGLVEEEVGDRGQIVGGRDEMEGNESGSLKGEFAFLNH